MHTRSGKVPVLTIKTERRYGRIVRQPDGSLVRIETTEHVVRKSDGTTAATYSATRMIKSRSFGVDSAADQPALK